MFPLCVINKNHGLQIIHKVYKDSFSIGFTFYYWDYYKNKIDENEQHFGNGNGNWKSKNIAN